MVKDTSYAEYKIHNIRREFVDTLYTLDNSIDQLLIYKQTSVILMSSYRSVVCSNPNCDGLNHRFFLITNWKCLTRYQNWTYLYGVVHIIYNPYHPPRAGFDRAASRRWSVRLHDGGFSAGGLAPALSPRCRVPYAILLPITRGLRQMNMLVGVTVAKYIAVLNWFIIHVLF